MLERDPARDAEEPRRRVRPARVPRSGRESAGAARRWPRRPPRSRHPSSSPRATDPVGPHPFGWRPTEADCRYFPLPTAPADAAVAAAPAVELAPAAGSTTLPSSSNATTAFDGVAAAATAAFFCCTVRERLALLTACC